MTKERLLYLECHLEERALYKSGLQQVARELLDEVRRLRTALEEIDDLTSDERATMFEIHLAVGNALI